MQTPHNMGFAVIDELAQRLDLRLRRSFRLRAHLASGMIEDQDVTLAKPDVYMNASGTVVAGLLKRKGFLPEDILIVADDVNLPEGQLRLRSKGSSGGHNGLQSVIDHLGHGNFARLRLGVGQTRAGLNLVEHVLTPFPPAAREKIKKTAGRAADAIVCALTNGLAAAMNRFNTPNQEELN